MKKYFFLVIPLVLVLLFSACNSQTGSNKSAGKNNGQSQGSSLKPGQAGFQEFPIGEEEEIEGMTIAGVYFQAVDMDPQEKAGLSQDEADIHIEADIKAAKDNKVGFGLGEFIPNLKVQYKVKNLQSSEEQEGTFMPMNASDGPHYGANIKMQGAGKYKVTFIIEPPQDYLLHVDKKTGVAGRFWKKPLVVSRDFNYIPIKK